MAHITVYLQRLFEELQLCHHSISSCWWTSRILLPAVYCVLVMLWAQVADDEIKWLDVLGE